MRKQADHGFCDTMNAVANTDLVPGNVYKMQGFVGEETMHCAVYVGKRALGLVQVSSRQRFPRQLNSSITLPTNRDTRLPHAKVIQRAEKALADAKTKKWRWQYSLFDGNCEHFSMMCLINEQRSFQVENMTAWKKGASGIAHVAVELGSLPWHFVVAVFKGANFMNQQDYLAQLPI